MSDMSDPNAPWKTIDLAGNLDLRAAAPLHSSLLAVRGDPVCVNAENVVKVGAQCLQVLLSAQTTWERDGVTFELVRPSPAFLDALRTAGLSLGGFSEGGAV